MPLTPVIGSPTSTLGNVQPGLGGPATSHVRNTYLRVRNATAGQDYQYVKSARVSLGFDLAVSEATVVLAAEPGFGSYNDTIEIYMGAGVNNVKRFTGLLKQYARGLYPRDISLTLRGQLSRAADTKPFNPDTERAYQIAGLQEMLLTELMGTNFTTAADEEVVFALLQASGVDCNQSNIGGTGTDLLGLPPDATVWGLSESALSRVQAIDSASLGYRTFESIGGTVFRVQIKGWPGNVTQSFTFIEGNDISKANSTRTMLEFKNVARVDGYNYGAGAGIITFIADESSGGDAFTVQFSTPLAGRVGTADSGPGFACEDIADYLLSEWNRELVRVTLTTPRDDVIGPGQTHLLTTVSGQPDRLGTAEPLWVQRVDIEVNTQGTFRQTMTYLGGGVADGYGPPIDWENQ